MIRFGSPWLSLGWLRPLPMNQVPKSFSSCLCAHFHSFSLNPSYRPIQHLPLAEKVAATCKPEPSRRGFPTDPAAAEIDVLRDTSSLARDRAPDWRYLPSLDVIQFFYPKAARKADVEGRVTVKCRLDVEGTPHDCGIISETPTGQGFGAAALKVANLCEFLPARMNGEAVASTVRIPISFRIPD